MKYPEQNPDVTIEADLGALTNVWTGCRGRSGLHAFADGFEAGDEARQRVRCSATRQHHFDQRKLPAPLDSAIERSGELAARGHPFAHAAERGRDIGKMPVIEIVEARLWLEHPQHLPAPVVQQHDNRIESVTAAIAELPTSHLERALPAQHPPPQSPAPHPHPRRPPTT